MLRLRSTLSVLLFSMRFVPSPSRSVLVSSSFHFAFAVDADKVAE